MILVDTVNGNKLFRGPRPTTAGDLAGIRYDMNLETGWFEFLHGECAEEQQWCKQVGALYMFRPQSDVFPPSVFALKNLTAQITDALKVGHVLVHCLHGEDRTGMVIAAYRMLVQGWTFEHARDEMFSLGFHKFPYLWWVDTLEGLK